MPAPRFQLPIVALVRFERPRLGDPVDALVSVVVVMDSFLLHENPIAYDDRTLHIYHKIGQQKENRNKRASAIVEDVLRFSFCLPLFSCVVEHDINFRREPVASLYCIWRRLV